MTLPSISLLAIKAKVAYSTPIQLVFQIPAIVTLNLAYKFVEHALNSFYDDMYAAGTGKLRRHACSAREHIHCKSIRTYPIMHLV